MRTHVLTFLFLLAPVVAVASESDCKFERTLISGDKPDQFRCIKMWAEAGDVHWQYYLGLILTGTVPGPKNIPEGLDTLKKVAILHDRKNSAQAMRAIGWVYKRPGPYQNFELAYQWLFLASHEPPVNEHSSGYLPDKELDAVIAPERMKELEKSALDLLQNR